MAYYGLEPWGRGEATFQLAQIGATLANLQCAKGGKFSPSDFMPPPPKMSETAAADALKRQIGAMASTGKGAADAG